MDKDKKFSVEILVDDQPLPTTSSTKPLRMLRLRVDHIGVVGVAVSGKTYITSTFSAKATYTQVRLRLRLGNRSFLEACPMLSLAQSAASTPAPLSCTDACLPLCNRKKRKRTATVRRTRRSGPSRHTMCDARH
jgi:hypothetical protein